MAQAFQPVGLPKVAQAFQPVAPIDTALTMETADPKALTSNESPPAVTGWKACATELEVRRRRVGALHPDLCPKLHLAGAAFAVPPPSVRIVPRFDGAAVRAEVIGLDADAPARRLLSLARFAEAPRCPRCGQARPSPLEIAGERDTAFLAECFSLARRLLLSQYELADGELAELLSFPAGSPPAWIGELLRWCAAGGDTTPQSHMEDPPARPWWRRWERHS